MSTPPGIRLRTAKLWYSPTQARLQRENLLGKGYPAATGEGIAINLESGAVIRFTETNRYGYSLKADGGWKPNGDDGATSFSDAEFAGEFSLLTGARGIVFITEINGSVLHHECGTEPSWHGASVVSEAEAARTVEICAEHGLRTSIKNFSMADHFITSATDLTEGRPRF